MSQIAVKISYQGDIRKIRISDSSSLRELRGNVIQEFELKETPFQLQYRDSEGDLITVASDAGWTHAVEEAKAAKGQLTLLVVTSASPPGAGAGAPAPGAAAEGVPQAATASSSTASLTTSGAATAEGVTGTAAPVQGEADGAAALPGATSSAAAASSTLSAPPGFLPICRDWLSALGCPKPEGTCSEPHEVPPTWTCKNCGQRGHHRLRECPLGYCSFHEKGQCNFQERHNQPCPLAHRPLTASSPAAVAAQAGSGARGIFRCSNCFAFGHLFSKCNRPCRFFLRQECKKGVRCPLVHQGTGLPMGMAMPGGAGAGAAAGAVAMGRGMQQRLIGMPGSMPRAPYKLKECMFFAQGRCSKGEGCTFRHNEPVGGAMAPLPYGPGPYGAAPHYPPAPGGPAAAAVAHIPPISGHSPTRFGPIDFSALHMHASAEGTIAGVPGSSAAVAASSAEGEPGAAIAPASASAPSATSGQTWQA